MITDVFVRHLKGGESIKKGISTMRKEEFLRKVSVLDVENMKALGCAHIANHMNMSDKDLMRRAGKSDIYGASTFTCSAEEIVEAVKMALEDYADELVDWLNDGSDADDYVATFECDEVLGHGFYRTKWHVWDDGACDCHGIAVVLRKVEAKYETTFRFVTTYCEPTQDDIATTRNR